MTTLLPSDRAATTPSPDSTNPMDILIVGGGRVGRALATRLENRGETVTIVERDRNTVETARASAATVYHGDGTDTEPLESVTVDSASTVVAATGEDDTNRLVAQLLERKLDTESVMALVNDTETVDAFEELGIGTVSSVESVSGALLRRHLTDRRPGSTDENRPAAPRRTRRPPRGLGSWDDVRRAGQAPQRNALVLMRN